MNTSTQKSLLKLARKVLGNHFLKKDYTLDPLPAELKEKRGVFVTLHKKGQLRGCIGYILPLKSIYDGVKENALNAAFHDPRFKPLAKEELSEIDLEISILTPPQKLDFLNPNELIRKLRPKIDGVILEKNGHQATFLPQVWEDLSDPFDFLQQLSWKAGLSIDAWKTATIYTYQAEVFGEK